MRTPAAGRLSRLRGWWRRLALGLPTVTGLRPRGYFIPMRFAASASPFGYPIAAARLKAREAAFRETLAMIEGYAPALAQIGHAPPPAPRWTQDWFPRLDAAAAYAMVRHRGPHRIVEVGAGHSTRFFCRAIADAGLNTTVLAFDPAPRTALEGLAPLALRRQPVQTAGDAAFADLEPGDILSIDSSHVLMPGSDVDFLLNRVLPALPTGVHVHVHDIFLPDPYPADWDWRGYNEQNAVAGLLDGAAWRVDFAAHYVVTRMADALAASAVAQLPLVAGARESGLWLTRL
jgi:hypothetical protein